MFQPNIKFDKSLKQINSHMRLIFTRTTGQKMVLNSLLESAFYNIGNTLLSDPALGLSLITLLETFVPGYSPIYKFLLFAFGFNVTILVSLGVIL